MSWLSRFTNVFRSGRVDRDLEEELRFHLEERIASLIRRGMAPEEAARQAQRHFGSALQLRETSRDVKLLAWLESLFRDARFGLRMLRKHPAVTAAAVLSLSLAIGASTAAFALIDALILRPLPVRDPRTLVYLTNPNLDGTLPENEYFNYPLFERFRAAAGSQVDLFGMSVQGLRPAVVDGVDTQLRAQWISGNALETLGIHAALGRLLNAGDDLRPGNHPVAVLSHSFWQRRFGGSPAVLGRWLSVRGKHFQIVGVAQEGFTGVEPGAATDAWVPNMMWDAAALANSGWSWFRILGRLKPGVVPQQARQVLQAVFTNFRKERAQTIRPDTPREMVERSLRLPLHLLPASNGPSTLRQGYTRPLLILGVVVALVLFIACSNVANLFVARAAAREREMAMRVSIGAGRARLVQQVLVESGLLAGAACVLGVMFAWAAAPALVNRLSPSGDPAYLDLHFDWRVGTFVGLVSILTTILFGLAPALRAARVAPNHSLKEGGAQHSSHSGMLRPLVAAQVAFSFMVLFVGGLLLASFQKLNGLDLGFSKSDIVLYRVQARQFSLDERSRVAWLQLLDRVRQLAGVQAAGLSGWALFEGSSWSQSIRVPGRAPDSSDPRFLSVSPGFLDTMRIGLRAGRDFAAADSEPAQPLAVLVNQAFVQHYFPGENPLGKRFGRVEDAKRTIVQEIVGVVGDAKYRDLRTPAPPTVYVPLRTSDAPVLAVRTANPAAMASVLRVEIERTSPDFRVASVTFQSTLVGNAMIRERLLALLAGFFSLVALVLAAVGLYGVLSYTVVRRTRELGIRVALGARQFTVVRLVISEIVLVTLAGLAAGLAGGRLLAMPLESLLYEVKASDLASLTLPAGVLLLAAAIASLAPAARAAGVDPVVALRYE